MYPLTDDFLDEGEVIAAEDDAEPEETEQAAAETHPYRSIVVSLDGGHMVIKSVSDDPD